MLKFFGAKAQIFLKYNGDIKSLAEKITKHLILPEIYFDNYEEPPYDIFGTGETLGFEYFLEKCTDIMGFPFLFTIETEDSIKEMVSGQMHDLSPWLARFFSKICKIDSLIINSENSSHILFVNGEIVH